MAVTVGELTTRFPEFATAEPTLIQSAIDDAELMVDRDFYGTRADMAVKYYAAHLIATNPLGEMARLKKNEEPTTYLEQFNRIKYSTGAGCRVI